jgi:hypothetical protein
MALPAQIDQAIRITKRVSAELRNAQLVWAHFEALHDEAVRASFVESVYQLGLGYPLQALRLAIVRDTLMALCRATDPPGKDKDCLTLCHLSLLLADERVREDCEAAARRWRESTFPGMREKDAATCAAAIRAFTSAVPPKWTGDPVLTDLRLRALRERLVSLRDGSLAHAMECDGDVVTKDIRHFLAVTSEMVEHAELVFLGIDSDWASSRERRLKEAAEFWDRCQKGF